MNAEKPEAGAPVEPPPLPPYVSVIFSPEMGMKIVSSPDLTSGHLWAAAGYLNHVANQAMEDQHMAQLAAAARAQRPGSGLITPRDHLPPRRRQ